MLKGGIWSPSSKVSPAGTFVEFSLLGGKEGGHLEWGTDVKILISPSVKVKEFWGPKTAEMSLCVF